MCDFEAKKLPSIRPKFLSEYLLIFTLSPVISNAKFHAQNSLLHYIFFEQKS